VKWSRRKKLMLVTGGSGFLGRHLTGTDASRGWEIVAPASDVLDVTNREQVMEEVREWKPSAVVHLAYRKDDPRSIVVASENVACGAAAVKARLVHLSTDVVFGGRPAPYREHDAPTPITDYGRWKAEAEERVAAHHPAALMLRTSLLYGTTFMSQIQRDVELALRGRSTMTFFTDEVRCPVHALDVATAIAVLADRRDVVGPLHLAGPEAVSRADLARAFASRLGLDPRRVPTSSVANSRLERPARVVLDSSAADALGLRCRPIAEALAT
jgi:dTDP-4-dehydrorhamnose reductase